MKTIKRTVNEPEEEVSDIQAKLMENKEAEKERKKSIGSWGEILRTQYFPKVK